MSPERRVWTEARAKRASVNRLVLVAQPVGTVIGVIVTGVITSVSRLHIAGHTALRNIAAEGRGSIAARARVAKITEQEHCHKQCT